MTDPFKELDKKTVIDFIKDDIYNNDNFKTGILDKIPDLSGNGTEDRSSQGFYYERLWDICIKFGVTNLTLPSVPSKTPILRTSHIFTENPNKDNVVFKTNCWDNGELKDYLHQPIRSGSSGGYSDITFLNKIVDDKGASEVLYFISVKYFEKEKEIGKYDIGKLCSLIKEHEKIGRIIKVYIFVKDKKKAIEKFNAQHSSSNILINYINPGGNYEHIYDATDLHEAYFKLKKLLAQYNYLKEPSNITDFETNYLKVLKSIFIPRFHQQLFIEKIQELITNNKKNILVGAIPRSGKSYIMAGTILDCIKKNKDPDKKFKFVIMTPAPNETLGEYKDIFNNYIEFAQIDVTTCKGGNSVTQICPNKEGHCVILISKQRLGWTRPNTKLKEDKLPTTDTVDISEIKERVKKLLGDKPDIDVMFLDEAHFGMSTTKTQKIVTLLDTHTKDTVKIYVTATYNKPIQAYKVEKECKLTWDINDINIMKKISFDTINDNPIKERFGPTSYSKTLEYFGWRRGDQSLSGKEENEIVITSLKKEYSIFPKPYLITSIWDKEFLNVENLKIGDTEFGWDMNKLFAETGGSFDNTEQITEMMRYYFGYPNKKEDYDKQSFYRTRGIIPRIRNICANKCRTLQPKHKTTQLWFLPVGVGSIKNKVNALISLLTDPNEFKDIKKNYHFFVAVDIENKKGRTEKGVTYMDNPHSIKTEIEDVENKIKDGTLLTAEGSLSVADNLIILAGQRLQLGISLRNVDIVTLWNSTTSSDAIFQMLFRSMTEVDTPECEEGADEFCNQKKFGFMVDMNPQRSLINVELFSENITKQATDNDTKIYRQIADLINIDEDVLYDKYGDGEKDRFVNDLFNKLYESWNKNVENIRQRIRQFSFDEDTLGELKEKFKQIYISKKDKQEPVDQPADAFQEGKKKEKITSAEKSKDKGKKIKPEIDPKVQASELIIELISLLNIFSLYAEPDSKCILTDDKPINKDLTVIDDIQTLKVLIYKDAKEKSMFLKILNGRLTGDSTEPYSETVIDAVLKAITNTGDNRIMNKIIMTQKKQYYTIHEPDKLLEFINDNLKPKVEEKKQKGEVFTPIYLVREMLEKLDNAYIKNNDKSIFSEPTFKWFDPAVGIGNFPIIVYLKLMEGLKQTIIDDDERRKHILENMLYMSELTPKNVFICRKIFCGETYKLNLYKGNTILDKLPDDFVDFDVIMGNPPYNKGGVGKGGGVFWREFVDKSIPLLNENGSLLLL